MSGININFTANGVDIPTQLAEVKAAGFTSCRLNILDFNSSSIESWKSYALQALKLGFSHVVFGLSAGTTGITSSNWSNFSAAVLTLAQWFYNQNDARLELQIGNELELHHDGSITNSTLRSNIRTLATSCKATCPNTVVSYASSIANGDEISSWTSEGLGGLDRIGFNLYGADSTFNTSAQALVANFSGKAYVSEWGTSNGYLDFNDEQAYAGAINSRRKVLASTGLETYYYNYMESGNKWGVKAYPITGDFRLAWPCLLGVRTWFIGNPNVNVARGNVPSRSNSSSRPNTTNRASS